MPLSRRTLLAFFLVLAASLLSAAGAPAQTEVRRDAEGRAIHFEVLDSGVDVDWYASLLARAAHGDEISTVTIRIVSPYEIHDRCGRGASACYSGRRGAATITVPAGKGNRIASVLLHEYAHHLDANRRVAGVSEPNGTPVWWALRGMAELVRGEGVARDYRMGWDRAVGEIFAEDYAHVHVGGEYGISWLYPPTPAFKRAFLAELRGTATTPPPAANPATMTRPVTIVRSGTLAPVGQQAMPFRLLGPGRRVTFTAGVSPLVGSLTGARMVIACDGAVVRQARLTAGRSVTLDVPRLGPASCRAVLSSTSSTSQRFSLRLRLAVQPAVAAARR